MDDKNGLRGLETISYSVIRDLNPSPFVVRPEKENPSFSFGGNALIIFAHGLLGGNGNVLQITAPGRPFPADSQCLKKLGACFSSGGRNMITNNSGKKESVFSKLRSANG
jgi:hypothetical protein